MGNMAFLMFVNLGFLLLILLLIETHYMWQILMKLGGFLVYFCFCFDKFREARMIVEGT